VTITGLWGLITALSGGAPIVLLDRFEPMSWAEQVRRHRPRTLNLPPAALRMILDAGVPPADLASVSAVWSGAAPLDPALADRFEATYGVPVLQSYGATEFAGGLAGWNLSDWKTWGQAKRPSVGRLHPGVEARVLDPVTREVLSAGETGLLCFRTPHSVGAGPQDWVQTNDLGRIDADGFLFVDGRADDVINRGGFKVSAGTLKNVLEEHPGVREAAVVGLPDDRLGEVAGALVVTPGGADDPSDADLDAWVRAQLPPYYAPAVVRRVDAIPRNGAMKIVRPAVLALLTEDQ
jgi:acyl-coenzyme A synthetase/AMP-(fatty) acid ligase